MHILLAAQAAVPLLALLSPLAFVWTRRQNAQVRRKAHDLHGRVTAELGGLQTRSRTARRHIDKIADVYCRGSEDGRNALSRGMDGLEIDICRLSEDMVMILDQLPRAGRIELQHALDRYVAMLNEIVELGRDLDERHTMWSAALTGVSVERVEDAAHNTSLSGRVIPFAPTEQVLQCEIS